MGLKLPEERQEGGIFLRSDVRSTNAGGIVQSNFNTSDFDVIAGVVDLKNKTSYLAIPGLLFKTQNPDTDDIIHAPTRASIASSISGLEFTVPIMLPHNAIITEVIVYGNAAAEAGITWILKRMDHATTVSTMATASVGTADSTITNPTVDNENRFYFIECNQNEFDSGDTIYGARITYTTDYD